LFLHISAGVFNDQQISVTNTYFVVVGNGDFVLMLVERVASSGSFDGYLEYRAGIRFNYNLDVW
jgi:hypothetical protein